MRKISIFLLGILFILSFLAYALSSTPAYSAPPLQTTATPEDEPVTADDGSVVPGDYVGTIFSDGIQRQYFLHIPTGYDESTQMPLLISYHGFTGDPFSHARYTGFSELADKEGFIVVYPAGWQAGPDEPLGWFSHANAEDEFVDDVRFTRDLITFLLDSYAVNPARIYISGFSNGGGMANRIACDMSEEVAAVTAGGGTHLDEDLCEATRPVPILGLHGRNDDVTPYDGLPGVLEAIPEWAMEWAERNGCSPEPSVDVDQNLTMEIWQDCTDDATVALYTWDNWGHQWPIDGAEIVWNFVKGYTLPQEYVDARAEANNIAKPGDYGVTITSGGSSRSLALHVPEGYDGTTDYPLLISFHDYGSSAVGNAQITDWLNSTSDYIVVFPEGRGNPLAWFTESEVPEGFATDTQFIVDMIAHLDEDLAIDTDRVYLAGFSLGGGMVHRAGCDLADHIAGIAVVNGAHWVGLTCEPSQAVPVLAIHTLDNETVPFDGYPDTLESIPTWMSTWAANNGCDAEPTVETRADDVTVVTGQNCNAPVQLYTYPTGGHTWLPELFNPIILDFFSSLAE